MTSVIKAVSYRKEHSGLPLRPFLPTKFPEPSIYVKSVSFGSEPSSGITENLQFYDFINHKPTSFSMKQGSPQGHFKQKIKK